MMEVEFTDAGLVAAGRIRELDMIDKIQEFEEPPSDVAFIDLHVR
jgi:hypothetical protein